MLAAAVAAGVVPWVPAPRRGSSASRRLFAEEEFVYEAARDGYRCPAGRLLERTGQHQKHGVLVAAYSCAAVCLSSPFQEQWHQGDYWRLERGEHAALLEKTAARMAAAPHFMRQRKALVEHPFGTIKFWRDQRALLTRGRRMVQAKFSLSALADNFTRVLNLLSVPVLRQALQERRRRRLAAAPSGGLGARRRFWVPRWLPRRRGRWRGGFLGEKRREGGTLPPRARQLAEPLDVCTQCRSFVTRGFRNK